MNDFNLKGRQLSATSETKQEDDEEGTFICDYLEKMPFSVIKSSVRYYSRL